LHCKNPENWYADGASKPGALNPTSAGRVAASDRLLGCWLFAATALWFASVGEVCTLFVEGAAGLTDAFDVLGETEFEDSGVLISNILRTGGGELRSSMLRIGGLLIPPPFVPGSEACRTAGGSTSSMLLTDERGVAKGDPVCAGPPVELAEPLGLPPAELASRMAKTSLRSSSNTASIDVGLCAIIAVYVYCCAA